MMLLSGSMQYTFSSLWFKHILSVLFSTHIHWMWCHDTVIHTILFCSIFRHGSRNTPQKPSTTNFTRFIAPPTTHHLHQLIWWNTRCDVRERTPTTDYLIMGCICAKPMQKPGPTVTYVPEDKANGVDITSAENPTNKYTPDPTDHKDIAVDLPDATRNPGQSVHLFIYLFTVKRERFCWHKFSPITSSKCFCSFNFRLRGSSVLHHY